MNGQPLVLYPNSPVSHWPSKYSDMTLCGVHIRNVNKLAFINTPGAKATCRSCKVIKRD